MIEKIKALLINLSEEVLKSRDFDVQSKGKQDIVTDLDFQMERRIKDALLTEFPEDLFIGEEENHETLTDARTWVCDPIDGTLNFTCEIPYFGVQVALLENKQPTFSMIYLPELSELYAAQKHQGAVLYHLKTGKKTILNLPEGAVLNETAVLNESALSSESALSKLNQITLSQVVVTFGDFSKSNPSSRGYQLKAMGELIEKAMRIRIQGASSVDFAFVSARKNGCHILFSKNIWELAPGLLLAEEAGCKVQRISGAQHGFSGEGVVIAINDLILNEVIEVLEAIKCE